MQLISLTIKEDESLLEALVVAHCTPGSYGHTAFLEIAGPLVVINAMWAYTNRASVRASGLAHKLTIGNRHLRFEPAAKYVRIGPVRLPSGMYDMALVHPKVAIGALRGDTDREQNEWVLALNDEMPANFLERLNKVIPFAVKPEWAEKLWTEGQTQGWNKAVTKHESMGPYSTYSVCNNTRKWLTIIEDIIREEQR